MPETEVAAPETGAAEAPNPSIRDTLAAAFDASEKGELEVPSGPGPEAGEKIETTEAKTDDRPRGPDGKFIAKEGETEKPAAGKEPPAAPAEAKGAKPASAASTTPEVPAAAPAPAVMAPQHWPQADKEQFAKAPPEWQQWALRRDAEATKGLTAATQEIAPLRDVAQRVAPYLNHLGVRPEQAFDNIVQLDYALRTSAPEQKVALLQKLATDYGIPLPGSTPGSPETPAPEQGADQSWEDPAVSALRRQMADQAQQSQAHTQALQQQVHAITRDRFLSEITTLENEKDASGKPAHPHLATVAQEIGRLAGLERQAGRPIPALKTLYDHAVRLNPEISAQVEAERLAAERTKWEAESKAKEAEAQAKSKQAKGAAASINGAPRGGVSSEPAGSIRSILEQSRASQGGRV